MVVIVYLNNKKSQVNQLLFLGFVLIGLFVLVSFIRNIYDISSDVDLFLGRTTDALTMMSSFCVLLSAIELRFRKRNAYKLLCAFVLFSIVPLIVPDNFYMYVNDSWVTPPLMLAYQYALILASTILIVALFLMVARRARSINLKHKVLMLAFGFLMVVFAGLFALVCDILLIYEKVYYLTPLIILIGTSVITYAFKR